MTDLRWFPFSDNNFFLFRLYGSRNQISLNQGTRFPLSFRCRWCLLQIIVFKTEKAEVINVIEPQNTLLNVTFTILSRLSVTTHKWATLFLLWPWFRLTTSPTPSWPWWAALIMILSIALSVSSFILINIHIQNDCYGSFKVCVIFRLIFSLTTWRDFTTIPNVALSFNTDMNNTSLFQVPFVPFIPCLSIFLNVLMMVQLSYSSWMRFLIWMCIGQYTFNRSLSLLVLITRLIDWLIDWLHAWLYARKLPNLTKSQYETRPSHFVIPILSTSSHS